MNGMTHAKKRNIVLDVLAEVKSSSSSEEEESMMMMYSDNYDFGGGGKTRFLKLHPRHHNEEKQPMNMESCQWYVSTTRNV